MAEGAKRNLKRLTNKEKEKRGRKKLENIMEVTQVGNNRLGR